MAVVITFAGVHDGAIISDGEVRCLSAILEVLGGGGDGIGAVTGVLEVLATAVQGGPQVHRVIGQDPPGLGLGFRGLALQALDLQITQVTIDHLIAPGGGYQLYTSITQSSPIPTENILERRHGPTSPENSIVKSRVCAVSAAEPGVNALEALPPARRSNSPLPER